MKALNAQLKPKIIIVNHEKRLGVDTTCSNLAIKYDLLYISVYQLIKQHIENQTSWGKRLQATQRNKEITLTTQVRDEFNELEYTAVHFDQKVVLELIKATVVEQRQNQKFILLEGMFNQSKIRNEDDQLEVRMYDELLNLEQKIGEVVGMVNLLFTYQEEKLNEEEIHWEQFPEKEVAVK